MADCLQTTHLRFLNTLAKCAADLNAPKEDELSAWRFHQDLFDSGLERILLVSPCTPSPHPSLTFLPDRPQGLHHLLPVPPPRDRALRRPRHARRVRAAMDGLAARRPATGGTMQEPVRRSTTVVSIQAGHAHFANAQENRAHPHDLSAEY